MILKLEQKKNSMNCTEFEVIEKFDSLNSLKNTSNKISSFLTIQEGCDKFANFVLFHIQGQNFLDHLKKY